ncbi:unannotated protein [freshwater metagenome]|uniref:Unannotated protein n=1 Tax=freshwater metagenome TaxID=449393 RepID=A0A6J7K6U3_9ZZZZ|nr:hypothetical protein [Actinomycetota bacterium]
MSTPTDDRPVQTPEPAPLEWWEHEHTPGVGGAAARAAAQKAKRAREQAARKARAEDEAREVAGLTRAQRRQLRRDVKTTERFYHDRVRLFRREKAASAARDEAAHESRLIDQVVDALGDWVPLWAEQTPHEATTANTAAIYPFYNEEGLGHRGPLIGLNVTGGGSFSFDPWNLYSRTSYTEEPEGRRLITNGNMLVLGAPGNGKSALVKTMAYRQAAFGRRCEFIDPKGEYGDVVEALDGVVLALRPGGDQALNPLTDVGDPRMRRNLLASLTRALLGRALLPVEQAGLLAALAQADRRVQGREVCLPDVEDALRDPDDSIAAAVNGTQEFAQEALRDVMLTINLLRVGPLAGMFDRPTTIPEDTWDRRAISIDLSAVAQLAGADDAGQNVPLAVTMMCCSAFLTAKAIQRAARAKTTGERVPKTLRVNDEGWRVLAVPGQAAQYQSDFKLQRASGVVNVVVMHRFSDLRAAGDEGSRATKLAEGLLSDADTVVVYKQAEAEMPDVEQKLHLTESESTVIEHLEPGQALWIVGKWRGLIHHLRSQTEIGLSDTDEAMSSGLSAAGETSSRAAIEALATAGEPVVRDDVDAASASEISGS